MIDTVESKWSNNHLNPKVCEAFSHEVAEAWKLSEGYDIDYKEARPYKLSHVDFTAVKKNRKKVFVYAETIVNSYIKSNPIKHLGGMLVDDEGNILKLYGSEYFHKWAKVNYIEPKTKWIEKEIGANIVSLGIREKKPISMVGAENYSKFLINGAYYFSPISLDTAGLIGGFVVMVPEKFQSPYLRALSISITRAIELQMLWFDILENYSATTDGYGIIGVDQTISGKVNILTMSKSIFNILGLEYVNAYYEPLEKFIDPYPKNKRIWEIINQRQEVKDEMVTISCRGKAHNVNISVSRYQQSKFQMNGTIIAMTSLKRIKQIVNKYSSNNVKYSFEDIIGCDKNYQEVLERCKYASCSESNILLLGESGVGKDIITQAIHNKSARSKKPFIAINCASFSKELIASELFGYEEGAFTGAKKSGNIGKFEMANGGTLFLDEIGDMPLDVQAVLLRVLEERRFMRIGGTSLVNVDVRIIAATNKNLKEKMEQGLFREDLFYRLGIIRIYIPPLRERKNDILLLANHFIQTICERVEKPLFYMTSSAEKLLKELKWSGNVRELQNLLEGIINTQEDNKIDHSTILTYLEYDANVIQWRADNIDTMQSLKYKEIISEIPDEKQRIQEALEKHNYNKTKAAETLNMSRRTFYRRLEKYGLMLYK